MGIKEQLLDLESKISKGLELAYKKMIEFKKQKNSPIIVSKNGQIIEISVENILPNKK
jgi:hypothetical protein